MSQHDDKPTVGTKAAPDKRKPGPTSACSVHLAIPPEIRLIIQAARNLPKSVKLWIDYTGDNETASDKVKRLNIATSIFILKIRHQKQDLENNFHKMGSKLKTVVTYIIENDPAWFENNSRGKLLSAINAYYHYGKDLALSPKDDIDGLWRRVQRSSWKGYPYYVGYEAGCGACGFFLDTYQTMRHPTQTLKETISGLKYTLSSVSHFKHAILGIAQSMYDRPYYHASKAATGATVTYGSTRLFKRIKSIASQPASSLPLIPPDSSIHSITTPPPPPPAYLPYYKREYGRLMPVNLSDLPSRPDTATRSTPDFKLYYRPVSLMGKVKHLNALYIRELTEYQVKISEQAARLAHQQASHLAACKTALELTTHAITKKPHSTYKPTSTHRSNHTSTNNATAPSDKKPMSDQQLLSIFLTATHATYDRSDYQFAPLGVKKSPYRAPEMQIHISDQQALSLFLNTVATHGDLAATDHTSKFKP